MLRGDLARLGGEAPRLGLGCRPPRASALDESEGPGDHGRDQRSRDDGEQGPQATGPALRRSQLAFLGVPARVHVVPLGTRELLLVLGQLHDRLQASASVEISLVAPVVLPGASRDGQLPERPELLPILREPTAQPGPLPDQRLVRDLGRVVAHDEEPGGRQLLEHRSRLPATLALRDQLCQRHPPSGVLRRLAQLGQPEEHPPHERLLVLAAAQEDLLGGVRDRSPHAPGGLVARPREDLAVATGPRLVQGMGEQRQGAGLALDFGQHRVHQAGLETESRRAGRALDRPPQLVDAHGSQQVLATGQRGGETWMVRAASVEVRAEGDHDRH